MAAMGDDLDALGAPSERQATHVTIARKANGRFALPLVILVGVVGITYVTLAFLVDTSERVSHTHEILTELETLMSLVKDAETGQYAVTCWTQDNKNYLEPYTVATSEVGSRFSTSRNALDRGQPRPTGNASASSWRLLPVKKFKELEEETIVKRQNGEKNAKGEDAALEIVITNAGQSTTWWRRDIVNDLRKDGTDAVGSNVRRRLKPRRPAGAP